MYLGLLYKFFAVSIVLIFLDCAGAGLMGATATEQYVNNDVGFCKDQLSQVNFSLFLAINKTQLKLTLRYIQVTNAVYPTITSIFSGVGEPMISKIVI